jgi:hypothetical protein
MSESYIKPDDVSSQDAQNVLDFLNNAETADQIAEAVELADERDVGVIVAQHILDRRQALGGFSNLQQVAEVPQVGPERFTEIIITLRGSKEANVMSSEISKYKYKLLVPGLVRAVVELYGTEGTILGSAIFFDDSYENISSSQLESGLVHLESNFSSLPTFLDMLRNESPVILYFNSETDCGISTSPEPIGEGELP